MYPPLHPSLPPLLPSLSPSLFSPFQDDFVLLHVLNEYDTVIETPLKTEFLTLLSEKVKTLTQTSLQVTFNRRSVSECNCVLLLVVGFLVYVWIIMQR